MSRRLPLLAGAALAAASFLVPSAAAHATEEPPWVTPAQARQLCDQPWVGAGLGYNVIFGSGFIQGTAMADLIIASGLPDEVHADDGNDIVCLFAGDDIGLGENGDDLVLGFAGDDLENGGPGNDRLLGDDGVDTLNGNAGDDGLNGGPLADICNGGLGADTLVSC